MGAFRHFWLSPGTSVPVLPFGPAELGARDVPLTGEDARRSTGENVSDRRGRPSLHGENVFDRRGRPSVHGPKILMFLFGGARSVQ